jgi:hypothetical protein
LPASAIRTNCSRDADRSRHRRPARQAFADHHRYSSAEAADLVARAERDGLILVTTEKDLARLQGENELRALAEKARALPVRLVVDEAEAFRRFVLQAAGLNYFPPDAAGAITASGRGIGLLQIDAPVLQLLKRDRHAGHRAGTKAPRPDDAEITIEIFDLGLSRHRRGAIVTVEHASSPGGE